MIALDVVLTAAIIHTDAADSPEAESAGMSEPTQAETQEAESAQAEVEEPVGSSQDEFEEPAEPTQDISEELAESSHGAREEPIAELNQDIQPAREGE